MARPIAGRCSLLAVGGIGFDVGFVDVVTSPLGICKRESQDVRKLGPTTIEQVQVAERGCRSWCVAG